MGKNLYELFGIGRTPMLLPYGERLEIARETNRDLQAENDYRRLSGVARHRLELGQAVRVRAERLEAAGADRDVYLARCTGCKQLFESVQYRVSGDTTYLTCYCGTSLAFEGDAP